MSLSDWIAGHGKLCITGIIAITILMGAVSFRGFEISVDIEGMAPDTPEIRAYEKVMGITGGETTYAQLIFIADDGNILAVEKLSAILELESRLLHNETVKDVLIHSPMIGEFLSIVDFIAMGRIFYEFSNGVGSSMDTSILPDFVTEKFLDFVDIEMGGMRDITLDDKIAAFAGTEATGHRIDPPISIKISLSTGRGILNRALSSLLGGKIDDVNDKLSQPIEMSPMDEVSLKKSFDFIANPSFGIPGMPETSGMTEMAGMDSSGFDTSMITALISRDFSNETMRANSIMVLIPMSGSFIPSINHSGNSTTPSQALTDIVEMTQMDGIQKMIMSSSQVNDEVESASNELFSRILPVTIILILLILLFTFKSVIDTIIALLALMFAIIWTIGESVLLGFPLNQMTLTIPILLVGLGIDFGIHLILRYKEEVNGSDHRRAASKAVKHVGMPLLLATGVTALAFLSNISSPIPPIRDFGILAAISIASCLLIMILFVPAAKSLKIRGRGWNAPKLFGLGSKGKTKKKGAGKDGERALGRKMSFIAKKGADHPGIIGAILLITCTASIIGAFSLETGFDQTDFLPEGSELTETMMYSTENFDVSMMMDSYIYVEGRTTEEVQDMMREIAQDLSRNTMVTAANYTVSELDSGYIRVTAGAAEDMGGEKLYLLLKEEADRLGRLEGVQAVPTGMPVISCVISRDLEESQYYSMALTIIVSILVMAALFLLTRGSAMLSLITVLPVGISILWVMGTMALLGINFNLMTVMVYSLTVGLGLTYAIHITHRFTEELAAINDLDVVIERTVNNTGVALFGAAITTIAGFGSLMLSSMPPLEQFGFLVAISIGYSFLISIFVLPAILSIWAKYKYFRSGKKTDILEKVRRSDEQD